MIEKLKEVEVRDLWKHEQYDFSEWLAKEENIEYLNDILGLTLVEIDQEVYVGSYRCDLVAKDETTDVKVIIENQLEMTNHDHLGKVVTYASGLDAKYIVWIVKNAREEHRAAIEWLNNNTNDSVNFFLIEIHAYTIGDSAPAPKFEIVEKPNDFVKKSKTKNYKNDMSRAESERLEFWEEFNKLVVERNKPFNTRKANSDHWYNVAIGTTEAHVSINLVNREGIIVVELWITNNKDLFDKLYECKEQIEEDLDLDIEWERLDNSKASKIKTCIDGLDFDDHSNYRELMNETIDKAVKFRDVFKKYI